MNRAETRAAFPHEDFRVLFDLYVAEYDRLGHDGVTTDWLFERCRERNIPGEAVSKVATAARRCSPNTWGIKLGTQPAGAVHHPGAIAVGDILWFRRGEHRLEDGRVGRLHKRKVTGADRVLVTRILAGYVLVDYL